MHKCPCVIDLNTIPEIDVYDNITCYTMYVHTKFMEYPYPNIACTHMWNLQIKYLSCKLIKYDEMDKKFSQ